MWTLNCREHGGTFRVQSRRGRKPVRCSDEAPCSKLTGDRKVPASPNSPAAKAAERIRLERSARRAPDEERIRQAESVPEPRKASSAGLTKATAAKERLEALGWVCDGRGTAEHVTISAARGDEILSMAWDHDGTLLTEQYSFWSDVPQENDKPASSLGFDPDEMTDREIIRKLSGMKVRWWNVLGQREESAVVSPSRVTISHAYNGAGDETPADRILTFVDHSGEGFRSFRLGALVKVG